MDKPWLSNYEAHVPVDTQIPDRTLQDILAIQANCYPENTATIFFGQKMAYRELNEAVERFANGLYRLGVRKGDRVAIQLPNCPQFIIAYYGALRVGAIVVPCNPMYVARELENQLKDCGAEVVVVLSAFWKTFKKIWSGTQVKYAIVTNIKTYMPLHLKTAFSLLKEKKGGHRVSIKEEPHALDYEVFMSGAPTSVNKPKVDLDDIACLLYTGGTTGVPKGATLSGRNMVVNALQCHLWFKSQRAKEVVQCALPLSHGYGMTTCMNHGIFTASTMLLIPDPRDLKNVLKMMSRHKATLLPGVPTLFLALADYPDAKNYKLDSLRACISGGATLSKGIKAKFEALTGGSLVEGYGLSEASPVTHANPVYGGGRLGSFGLPWPSVECKLVSLDDGQSLVKEGEPGELWIRGPQIMQGYWNNPKETGDVLVDGWLKTGDIVVMDPEGYFYLISRKKDVIIAGGYKVFPSEIEDVLAEHPQVREVVAVGIPHPYRGETVKAFVILEDHANVSEREIISWCRQRLAKFKVPTSVEFREQFPRTSIGKVLRRELIPNPDLAQPESSEGGV